MLSALGIRQCSSLVRFWSKTKQNQWKVCSIGCDTGFGHRLALRLNQIGFKVYATVLSPTSSGAQELKVNASQPNRMVVLKMDVTSDEDINKVHEEISQNLEDTSYQLWGVVNNAGIANSGLLEWGTIDTYRQIFEVNTFGAVRVTLRFLPLIRQSKGIPKLYFKKERDHHFCTKVEW